MAADEVPERQFPLLGRQGSDFAYLPWGMLSGREARVFNNHGMTLDKLARRGGVSVDEALAIIEDRDFPTKRDEQAPLKLHTHMMKYLASRKGP